LSRANRLAAMIEEEADYGSDKTRILATGAAATAMAATPQLFAQQTGPAGSGARFYEKGSVRIAYQEAVPAFH